MARLAKEVHPLLGEDVVEALRAKQVFGVLDFINADTQQIMTTTRLTFKEALAVKNFLLEKYGAAPQNGFDLYKTTLSNTAIIPTGIESVDHLLNGGLFTGNIYEICGLPYSGKTNFALTLAKNVVLNMKQKVWFFDTKNDISAQRLKNMFSGYDQDLQRKSLSKITIQQTYTKYDLINGLYGIKNNLEKGLKLRLIIIDSLPVLLLNSNDHMKNNACLNHLVNIMRYISVEHHVGFLITNLITTWNDTDFKNQQSWRETIACGKYWQTVPNTRLRIDVLESQNMYKFSLLSRDISTVAGGNNSVEVLRTNGGFLW